MFSFICGTHPNNNCHPSFATCNSSARINGNWLAIGIFFASLFKAIKKAHVRVSMVRLLRACVRVEDV